MIEISSQGRMSIECTKNFLISELHSYKVCKDPELSTSQHYINLRLIKGCVSRISSSTMMTAPQMRKVLEVSEKAALAIFNYDGQSTHGDDFDTWLPYISKINRL